MNRIEQNNLGIYTKYLIKNNLAVNNEEMLKDNNMMQASMKSSVSSKRNRRYSSQNRVNASFAGSDFKLIDDNWDVNLYDQINKSIMKIDEDDNGTTYIEGTNGRRISIFGVKSPILHPKKEHYQDSQDRATYQASTLWSNTMNKSSKKEWIQVKLRLLFLRRWWSKSRKSS